MSKVKLFISHSSKDVKLATLLVHAIDQSLKVPSDSIRCTSVPGYELDLGVLPADQLRAELSNAKLVIGILSPNSRKADWVLFELGAAWGLIRKSIPILAGGLTYKDLPGPLQTAVTTTISDLASVTRLIQEVKSKLDWPIGNLIKGQAAQEALAKHADSLPQYAYASERLIRRDQLQDPTQGLSWSDIDNYCTEEMFVWGWSCRNIVGPKSRNVFSNMISKGIKLHFLIQDPDAVSNAEQLNFGPVCDWSHKEIVADILRGIESIQEFRRQVPLTNQSNIELRKTNWVITWSGIAIDPNTNKGILQIELYHYANPEKLGNHLDSRPQLILSADSVFFKGFCNSVKAMWDASTPV